MEGKFFRIIAQAAVGIGVFILDRVLKNFALSHDGSVYFFSEKIPLYFERFENPFLALSIPVPLVFGLPLMLAALFFLAVFALRSVAARRVFEWPYFLCVMLGAASNIFDRVAYGFVVDYIHIWILPVFNLADILIFAGILHFVFEARKKSH